MINKQLLLSLSQLPELVSQIIQDNTKLIYFAWASASGKSFIAQELVTTLEQQGKKVLLISSDNYYSNESQLKYIMYGTFDHPKLIDYDKLAQNIKQFFEEGSFQLPVYSFIEKRTVEYIPIQGDYDIVIVEWLYSVSELPKTIKTKTWDMIPYTIIVHAPIEEIIFRRLLRDMVRIQEPIHTLIDVMSNVFPMRNIFGVTQQEHADCIITNDYSILDAQGRQSYRKKIKKSELPDTKPYDTYYTNDYIYDDSDDSNGKIIVSEIYRDPRWLLDHVILQKRSSDPRKDETDYSSISMPLYKPGISTEIHTLLQWAGLRYEWSYKKIIYKYNNGSLPIIYKEKNNIFYKLISEN